ncbi:MAG: hypothetical protein L3J89_04605 [Gammaproteobacteria bacterium]|nr:hypothetical protein [Gammaproteobacteria bacterium]
MQNSLKKTITATIFALFVILPFGAQAAEQSGTAPAQMPTSVQQSLNSIVSAPLTANGGLIIDKLNHTPFASHETTNAWCSWICGAGVCWFMCW